MISDVPTKERRAIYRLTEKLNTHLNRYFSKYPAFDPVRFPATALTSAFENPGLPLSVLEQIVKVPVPDADDSALAMKVLAMGGYSVGLDFLQYYKSEKGYLCFPFERNPSVSTNFHILDAMEHYHSHEAQNIRAHVLDFLYNSKIEDTYWKDKWHDRWKNRSFV